MYLLPRLRLTCYVFISFNPLWGVNGLFRSDEMLVTLSLRRLRNDIKEGITTEAQNSSKSSQPPSFQMAAVI